jgi:hypothetical protein
MDPFPGMHQPMLAVIFALWMIAGVVVGLSCRGRAPALSVALFGSVIAAVVGFFVADANGPAGVPADVVMWASGGLVLGGLLGVLATRARPPVRPFLQAALIVFVAAPSAAIFSNLLLQAACPLYVSGRGSGFCNFEGIDVIGGWIAGVTALVVLDALFICFLLLVSAWQARRFKARAMKEDGVAPPQEPPWGASWLLVGVVPVVVIVVLIGWAIGIASKNNRHLVLPAASPRPWFGFGAGTLVVPKDVGPGTYRTIDAGERCHWERLRNLNGEARSIIAEGTSIAGPIIVTIERTDAAFRSHGCGDWSNDILTPSTQSRDAFGDGMFKVGNDIAASTYRVEATSGCYWARLKDFTGEPRAIIESSDGIVGPFVVTLGGSHGGVESHGCGVWNKV